MKETLKLILAEVIDNPEISETINDNTNLFLDIGLDSLKMIELIVKVEEKLNIYIDFDKFSYEF